MSGKISRDLSVALQIAILRGGGRTIVNKVLIQADYNTTIATLYLKATWFMGHG